MRLVDRDVGIGLSKGADVLGAGLLVGALMLGVYTIVETTTYGWGSLHTLGLGALAVVLLGSFIVRESRATTPLVPLGIFRSRNMAGANLIQALMVAGMFGMFFLGAIYLQRVLGYTALEVGLAFLPVAVLIGALSLGVSARLNMRFGARATLVPALTLMAGGLVLFSRAPVDASYVSDILPAMVLLGTGAGLAFPSLMTLAMSSATQEDSGLASGLVNTTLQVGGALGLAVIATLSTTRTENLLAGGDSQASALTGGFHLAFLIGAGLVLAALAVAAEPCSSRLRRFKRCPRWMRPRLRSTGTSPPTRRRRDHTRTGGDQMATTALTEPAIEGRVATPSDPGWGDSRRAWNLAADPWRRRLGRDLGERDGVAVRVLGPGRPEPPGYRRRPARRS